MGLGQLKDAAVRERRRRLLGDDMVAAARRRPSRAQLGALVDDRQGGQTHSHLAAATATSDEEETRTLETLIKGRPTNAHLAATATTEGMVIPIFVRHGSGELTFTVRMDQCINDLMQLYALKTKTTLDSQYFVYKRKKLDPHHMWLSYGLKRDTTVHVCTRLLGGANDPNLQDYINSNKHNFVQVVSLPDGKNSLQMTRLGCQFLSSWIRCFTKAFIAGRSWNGKFKLVDFIFSEGHVRSRNKPPLHTTEPGSVAEDITRFVKEVKDILRFSDIQNVVSMYPPYVKACLSILNGLVAATGPLAAVTGSVSNEHKLLLETLVCCMTSYARARLIIELFRKYEGANEKEASLWKDAINKASCPPTWCTAISKSAVFNHFIQKRNNDGKPYPKDKVGAFTFLRDVVMHVADYSEKLNAPQLGDGIELMIPADQVLNEFLPNIISNLIENNIDISTELSAAIHCACNICDS